MLRLTRIEVGPAAALGALMLSDCMAGAVGVQPDGVRVRVPEDGVTVSPPVSGTARQWTVVACTPAEATPIWRVAGCPAVTVVAPLGCEKPTAGSWPVPKDGGLAFADEPQAASGVPGG